MRPINPVELLNTWDRFNYSNSVQKAISLLRVACSDGKPLDPGLLTIGERDLHLFQLREWMFGPTFLSISSCPICGEYIEWTTSISELRYLPQEKNAVTNFSFDFENFHITYRLPNSYDLSGIAFNEDRKQHLRSILAGCIIQASKDGVAYEINHLPEDIFDILDSRMSDEDPQANIQMNLLCTRCNHKWQSPFDIVSYLWTEIDNWAKHMLHEIAILAAAFGWSESDILNMSPKRRQRYLEILGK